MDAETNTNPYTANNIALLNSKVKKKQHNTTIKNFNPNEPKIHKSNLLYTDKQKYRRYKTKIEPKLFNKIMVDEEEDLIAKIRKEFGIEDKTKKNYSEAETSGIPSYPEINPVAAEQERAKYVRFEPKQQNLMNDFTDMTNTEIEDLLGGLITSVEDQFKIADVADDDRLVFSDDEGDKSIFDDDGFEVPDDEPAALTREASRGTVLSAATTAAIAPEDLDEMAARYGITFPGPKPKTEKGIKKREKLIRQEIAKKDRERGVAAP